MFGTKTSFFLLLLTVLIFSAYSDEQEKYCKWFRKAAHLSGNLCLEGKPGAEGEVLIKFFATSNVLEVNLTELGVTVDAPQDGTPNSIKPGRGRVHWNSD